MSLQRTSQGTEGSLACYPLPVNDQEQSVEVVTTVGGRIELVAAVYTTLQLAELPAEVGQNVAFAVLALTPKLVVS